MYGVVMELWNKRQAAAVAQGGAAAEEAQKQTPLNKMRNMDHHTPFTLAADLGKQEVCYYLYYYY